MSRSGKRSVVRALIGGVALAGATSPVVADDFKVLMQNGDSFDGATVTKVESPAINASGQAAFIAISSGYHVVRVSRTGAATTVVRTLAAAPGTAGATFATFSGTNSSFEGQFNLNDAGDVLFYADLVDGVGDASQSAHNEEGIWVGGVSPITMVLRDRGNIPGLVGSVFEAGSCQTAFNAAGKLAIAVRPLVGSNIGPNVVLVGQAGALQNPAGATYVLPPYIDASGDVIWYGHNGLLNQAADFLAEISGSSTTTLATKGDPAPGFAGQVIGGIGASGIDSSGEYVGGASATDQAASASTSFLFTGTGTTQSVLFRQGDPAPSGSGTFTGFGGATISSSGHLAFTGFTTAGNGMFLAQGATPVLGAIDGMQAPGLPTGVVFKDLIFPRACMNSNGQVAMLLTLTGGDTDFFAGNEHALYVANPDGTLHLVVREADQLKIGGTTRQITNIDVVGSTDGSFTGPESGQVRWFDDAGEIVFSCQLDLEPAALRVTLGAGSSSGPTFDLTKADVTLSGKANKDQLTASGTFPKLGTTFDPRHAGGAISFDDPGAPVQVNVPADDPGWKGKKGVYAWKSAKGVFPQVAFTVDAKKGKFTLSVTKADFVDAAPTAGFQIGISVGTNSVDLAPNFVDRKKGRFRFRTTSP